QNKSALFDVFLKYLFLNIVEAEIGGFMAVEIQNRRLQQLSDQLKYGVVGSSLNAAGVEDLPAHGLMHEHILRGICGKVSGVIAVVVPILGSAIGELADQDGRSSFAEKQKSKASGNNFRGLSPIGLVPAAIILLHLDQKLAAFSVPIEITEETLPG